MPAALMDVLMILALGILAGTGSGLIIGFLAKTQENRWDALKGNARTTTLLLILCCSAAVCSVLAWYTYLYAAQ